jgi:hypothetical protein
MHSKLKFLLHVPWYVFLLSIYPVLTLYGHNVSETDLANLWRPLLISMAGSVLLFLLFRLILKDWHRAALVTVILVVMFFAYGHVYTSLKYISFLSPYVHHRSLLPIWLLLTSLGVWLVVRKSSQPEKLTLILNGMGVVALMFPLVQVGLYSSRSRQAQTGFTPVGLPGLSLPAGQTPPDIYYLILDAYGNTKTLTDLMGFDNTEFLNRLRAQGFYVADCSQSNYATTRLSLVSSLNLDYLSNFKDAFIPGEDNTASLALYLKGNAARISLKALGYRIVAFETGFKWSEWKDADLYLSQNRWREMNDFESLLVNTSGLRAIYDLNLQQTPKSGTSLHRERVLYTLDSLRTMPSVRGPKFVFAHIIIPHDPFDIGTNGEAVDNPAATTTQAYFEGYRRQAIYINKVIPEITAALIANSTTPPVIVIQGDHGPWNYQAATQRLGILNAYYLPAASNVLYPTITPVNTFRVILNAYFGGKFPLLEDLSYMSNLNDMFGLTEVTNPCLKK